MTQHEIIQLATKNLTGSLCITTYRRKRQNFVAYRRIDFPQRFWTVMRWDVSEQDLIYCGEIPLTSQNRFSIDSQRLFVQ